MTVHAGDCASVPVSRAFAPISAALWAELASQLESAAVEPPAGQLLPGWVPTKRHRRMSHVKRGRDHEVGHSAPDAGGPVCAGLRACVKRQEPTCRASRPRCWVAPTGYLRSAAIALAALVPLQTGRRGGSGEAVLQWSNAVGGLQWSDVDGSTSGGSAGSAPAGREGGRGRGRPRIHDAEELAFLCRSLRMDALPAVAQRRRSLWSRLLQRQAAPVVVLFGGGALAPVEAAAVRKAALVVRFDGSDPGCGPYPTTISRLSAVVQTGAVGAASSCSQQTLELDCGLF